MAPLFGYKIYLAFYIVNKKSKINSNLINKSIAIIMYNPDNMMFLDVLRLS